MAIAISAPRSYTTATSNGVWQDWVNVGTSTGPMTITYADTTTWGRWLTTGTASTTNEFVLGYDPAYTWREWEDEWEQQRRLYYQYPAVREPTQEELDAAQRRREEASARQLAAAERLVVAEVRALELFRSLLSADQIRTMDEDGEVWVKGSEGGFYVIETRDGRVHGNIRSVDEHGCMLGRLCVQPNMYAPEEGGALPSADGHVGQLLAIRFNERQLRDTANWSSRRACQQPDVPILRAA